MTHPRQKAGKRGKWKQMMQLTNINLELIHTLASPLHLDNYKTVANTINIQLLIT